LYGIAIVFDVVNLRTHEPVSYLATINLLIAAILSLLFWRKLPGIQKFMNFKLGSKMILLGVFSTGQAVAYFLAIKSGPLSQIAAISQAQVALTVLLAVFLLGEKDKLPQKFLASVMVMIGVILLR
ncbi:MAG: EamA family transporter, partial [Microgenomates group bacterium]